MSLTAHSSNNVAIAVPSSSRSAHSTVKFGITGMTCASCVSAIENALIAEPGIVKVSVSLLMERGDVVYDKDVVDASTINEIINDIGYESRMLTDDTSSSSESTSDASPVIVRVSGMTCASCVATIERALSSLAFVDTATVNLITEKATITLAPTDGTNTTRAVAVTTILSTIEDIGFEAKLEVKSRTSESKSDKQSPVRYYRNLLAISLVFAIPTFLLSMILPYTALNHWISLRVFDSNLPIAGLLMALLATPVQFGTGQSLLVQAWKAARHGSGNMALLVSIGTLASYCYASIGVIQALLAAPNGDMLGGNPLEMSDTIAAIQFYETSSTLITFVLLGKYLESAAKNRTTDALTKLLSLQATMATLLVTDPSTNAVIEEREVDCSLLSVNDRIKVIRGSKIPADGTITEGEASINESAITGESIPVTKTVGDRVIGGTLCEDGTIIVTVSASTEHSVLSQIVKLMEDAQSNKAPIQQLADRISAMFVPMIVTVAVLVWLLWFLLSVTDTLPLSYYHNNANSNSFLFSFLFAITTLVIACPCALGLATPTAVMVGTGVGAKLGILIKGGEALETAHKITHFIFDKTGTLTIGKPQVNHFTVLVSDSENERQWSVSELCYLLGSAESNSEHILGKACIDFALSHASKPLASPTNFTAVTGRGLQCVIDTAFVVHIGNRQWMMENNVSIQHSAEAILASYEVQGETGLCFSVNRRLVAVIGLIDRPKPEAQSIIDYLINVLGITVYMCTGDNRRTALTIGRSLNIPISNIVAEALPQTKHALVTKLQSQGYTVAMIGDGINDSPALAASNLGFSIGNGTDIAIEAASVILMRNDLRDVITALDLSRTTFNRIKINFLWAFVYNLVGIPIAAGVFYPIVMMRLPPEFAAFAMAMSSVSVIVSSLALRLYSKPVIAKRTSAAPRVGELELVSTSNDHELCCPCDNCTCADNIDENELLHDTFTHPAQAQSSSSSAIVTFVNETDPIKVPVSPSGGTSCSDCCGEVCKCVICRCREKALKRLLEKKRSQQVSPIASPSAGSGSCTDSSGRKPKGNRTNADIAETLDTPLLSQ